MIPDPAHPFAVTSFEEVGWGLLLVAITMTLHGFGMVFTVRVTNIAKAVTERKDSFIAGVGILILASSLILMVHLSEVVVWAAFFFYKHAMPDANTSYYFALMEYTTVGSNYNLPRRLRLLEGVIAVAGLITFAWSTGVLLALAQDFQDREVKYLELRRKRLRRHDARSNQSD